MTTNPKEPQGEVALDREQLRAKLEALKQFKAELDAYEASPYPAQVGEVVLAPQLPLSGQMQEISEVLNAKLDKILEETEQSDAGSLTVLKDYIFAIEKVLFGLLHLDTKHMVKLEELRRLLNDLEHGRRNRLIPRRRAKPADSSDKTILMAHVAALVTVRNKCLREKIETACRHAARLLVARHVKFDSGDQELWEYIRDYRKDLMKEKRGKIASAQYDLYTQIHRTALPRQISEGIENMLTLEKLGAEYGRVMIEIIENNIDDRWSGQDLRSI